ncbi:MAG: tetratricopeptide repeat protein [Spirochaetaceae bacterium]|nr:tetratricopeptide repeat protein [Spirochaetaceae bacterium]
MSSSLDNVLFIKLPEDFSLPVKDFEIRNDIPLPVFFEGEKFKAENLTEEAIFAGILILLAHDTQNPHIPYYRELIKKARPKLREELTSVAIMKALDEEFTFAEEIFATLRGLNPDDTLTILNSANFFSSYADYFRKINLFDDATAYNEKAAHFYSLATDSETVIPDAYFYAGLFFEKMQNFSRCKEFFESYLALVSNEKDEDGKKNLDKKIGKANLTLQKISTSNLDDALFQGAYEAVRDGDIDGGIEKVRLFLAKNSKSPNGWFLLGWALRSDGKFPDALNAFKKSRELGLENSEIFNEMAICHMELGGLDEAEKLLCKALEMDGENSKIISNLGFLALRRNDEATARKYFLSVLEFSPEDKIALSALEMLER